MGIGPCAGDSGSPVAYLELDDVKQTRRFVQLGLVQGGIGECGSQELPGIYVRVNSQPILSFVRSIIGKSTFYRLQERRRDTLFLPRRSGDEGRVQQHVP